MTLRPPNPADAVLAAAALTILAQLGRLIMGA